MKLLTIFFLSIFLLFSCSNNNEEWVIKESSQIINEYVDTLEWSIQDSREVKELIESNQDKLLDTLNSIK